MIVGGSMKQTNSARAARVFNEWYYKNKALDPLFDDDDATAEQEAEYKAMMDAEFKDN
jgi:hypothetical protein